MLEKHQSKIANLEKYLVYCSANYQKLCQMLPANYKQGDRLRCKVNGAIFELEVLECNPYTDILTLCQYWTPSHTWLTNLVLQLRLCHDVKVAEVIAYQFGDKAQASLLHNASADAKHITDKQQIQYLLFEWLLACKPFSVIKYKI